MASVFNVTAAYDKPSYVQGETMTVTISGDEVHTSTSQGQIGPLDLTITSIDGDTEVINVPQTSVTITTSAHNSVKITSVSDTSPTPRTWTIDASGTKITAVA